MARRGKKEEEHENLERWLVSYADFITLLFAFFVVMYALTSANEGKYRVISESLSQAFRAGLVTPQVQEGKDTVVPSVVQGLPLAVQRRARPSARARGKEVPAKGRSRCVRCSRPRPRRRRRCARRSLPSSRPARSRSTTVPSG